MKYKAFMDALGRTKIIKLVEDMVPMGGDLLLLCQTGSRLHGTSTETSDYDFTAVYKPGLSKLITQKVDHVISKQDEHDGRKVEITLMSLQHWLNKLTRMEANAVELFFASGEYANPFVQSGEFYIAMLHAEYQLVHRQALSFIGMADAEIKRYTKHIAGVNVRPNINKDLAHGVRSASEAIQILQTGKIMFPLSNATHLLEIKTGIMDAEDAFKELIDLSNAAKVMQDSMDRTDTVDPSSHMDSYILKFYEKLLK